MHFNSLSLSLPLSLELQRMRGLKCTVIPIVIGGLGAVTPHCVEYLRAIPREPDIHMSERILRNVLGRRR